VGLVVNEVAQGKVFSEYSGFLCQFSFYSSITSGTYIGPLAAGVPNGFNINPPHKFSNKPNLREQAG
jgi:hypothetical protein